MFYLCDPSGVLSCYMIYSSGLVAGLIWEFGNVLGECTTFLMVINGHISFLWLFRAESPHQIFSGALRLFSFQIGRSTLSPNNPPVVSPHTNKCFANYDFPFYSKTLFFPIMYVLCISSFFHSVIILVELTSCCRAQTGKVIAAVSSLHVYMKVADLNGVSSRFLKMNWGTQLLTGSVFSYPIVLIFTTFSRDFPNSVCSTHISSSLASEPSIPPLDRGC